MIHIEAESTARIIEVITAQMLEWAQADFDENQFPNFSIGERFSGVNGHSYVITHDTFTESEWACTPRFYDDAEKALAAIPHLKAEFKEQENKARESLYRTICEVERATLATAITLLVFDVSDLDKSLSKVPKIENMKYMTISEQDKQRIFQAVSEA